MSFFLLLAGVNIACFLPLYLLNVREQPNPFAFLRDAGFASRATLRLLYARKRYTDPLRINFDFTFVLLLAGYADAATVSAALVVVLALSFILILYASVMHVIFKRAPALSSDLVLLKAGWSVAHRHRHLVLLLGLLLLTALAAAAWLVTRELLANFPVHSPLPASAALLLVPACVYHWRRFQYAEFFWRVTYSPTLHLLRNLEFCRRTQGLLQQGADYFSGLNEFSALTFERPPHVVVLCIESYGSVLYRDPSLHAAFAPTAAKFDAALARSGYRLASNLSEAPIFAGGSWLSYTTATYGALFDDANVHAGLFGPGSQFGCYESLFHVLRRNGYANNLLCPLGGVGARYVDWEALDRCFLPQRKITFEDLQYTGSEHSFFVPHDLYAAPDQYALNFAYESVRAQAQGPVSLFFCTINSHYPWHEDLAIVDDWRQLNAQAGAPRRKPAHGSVRDGYVRSMRYQLDNVLQFVCKHAADDLLVLVFGDHQPPFITPESMGKHTPVHILSKRAAVIDEFMQHGFVATLDVAGQAISPIKHQGILSLLMRAMAAGYGTDPTLRIDYRPDGVALRHAR